MSEASWRKKTDKFAEAGLEIIIVIPPENMIQNPPSLTGVVHQ